MKKHLGAIRIICLTGLMFFFISSLLGCALKEPTEIKGTIRLAVTEELSRTGLFPELLSIFTDETGWQVETIVIEPDSVLEQVETGAVDALFLNEPLIDQILVSQGHATPRLDVLFFQNEVKGMTAATTVSSDLMYGITVLNSSLHPAINETGALELSNWLAGQVAQSIIGSYGLKERRGQLFAPVEEGANVCKIAVWYEVMEGQDGSK